MPKDGVQQTGPDSFWLTNKSARAAREVLEEALEGGVTVYKKALRMLLAPVIEGWGPERFDQGWRETVRETLKMANDRAYGGVMRPRPPDEGDEKKTAGIYVIFNAPRPDRGPKIVEATVARPRRIAGK
jgi:hypothetical protein